MLLSRGLKTASVSRLNPLQLRSVNMDGANDGRIQKMEVDYSSTVDEKVPQCEKLAKVQDSQSENLINYDHLML